MSDGWGEFPFEEELEHWKKETASITLRRLADDVIELREDIRNDPSENHAYENVLELIAKRLEEEDARV